MIEVSLGMESGKGFYRINWAGAKGKFFAFFGRGWRRSLSCRGSCQEAPKCLRWEIVSVLESIVKDLESLPATKLVEVAHFVSSLNPRRREERLAALKDTAGCMSGEDSAAFEKAVREEGGRICSVYCNSVID